MTTAGRRKSVAQATKQVMAWFEQQGWKAFAYQKAAWREYLSGRDGLIHARTGTGKTLAAFLGAVIEQLSQGSTGRKAPRRTDRRAASRLRVLWITPLRALAADTEVNLRAALDALNVPWFVERRTSDTSSSVRARQSTSLPDVLVTTPESVCLLLSREDAAARFSELRLIVVDEWHELLGSKRGVQTELALARLRAMQPKLRVWGISATIGNLQEALATLVGPTRASQAVMVQGRVPKPIEIEALIPPDMDRFPWAGHLGNRLVAQVADIVRSANTSLVFTNTRSQAEIWYRELLAQLPELAGQMAVHHGSLDQRLRSWTEDRLRDGRLKCCVCTSSLELGVDYPVVDRVIQVGSPKGCARLVQRAGRSGHRPGQPSRITFVPTHALELVEIAALKKAVAAGHIEHRSPVRKPLDVLAQHVVTVALADGFESQQLLAEVRSTMAYAALSDQEWQWVIDFAERGGSSLAAYPDYRRITRVDGIYRVVDRRIAALHRMSIGTIVGDAAMQVRYQSGKVLGTVEESFLGRISPGDRFVLGGKLLELIRIHDNTAWVKRGRGKETAVPRWMGGRMPLSSELSQALRDQLEQALAGKYSGRAMLAVRPMLELQGERSVLPAGDELLIEQWSNRDGHHLFVYPFEGRLVHEGLAALWALRMARLKPITFSLAMNDYGFLLVSPTPAPLDQALASGLLSTQGVAEDILSSLNATEMCRRQFREIARVAGLLFEGYPGQRKTGRHLQASSNLFFDVFREYDPENLLLHQARREVLERQLEQHRLQQALSRLSASRILVQILERPSPLCFPLIADRLRDRLSSESFAQRIERLQRL